MVEADEVDAEAAEAAGDAGGVGCDGEVRAEREVDAEEADAAVVGGVRAEVGADGEEMAVADEDAVGGGEGLVQRAEIGGAVELVLIEGEGVERLRGGGSGQQDRKEDRFHDRHLNNRRATCALLRRTGEPARESKQWPGDGGRLDAKGSAPHDPIIGDRHRRA